MTSPVDDAANKAAQAADFFEKHGPALIAGAIKIVLIVIVARLTDLRGVSVLIPAAGEREPGQSEKYNSDIGVHGVTPPSVGRSRGCAVSRSSSVSKLWALAAASISERCTSM